MKLPAETKRIIASILEATRHMDAVNPGLGQHVRDYTFVSLSGKHFKYDPPREMEAMRIDPLRPSATPAEGSGE